MTHITDEQRIAWAKVNWALDLYGDGPVYREAWDKWAALGQVRSRNS